mmetsp:Transcript_123444/g.360484  ORF Transcript_123444/g.360484 Transcript_123444/m.360484 type:complete len:213 (-) Transcript_123444:387-1025(-)
MPSKRRYLHSGCRLKDPLLLHGASTKTQAARPSQGVSSSSLAASRTSAVATPAPAAAAAARSNRRAARRSAGRRGSWATRRPRGPSLPSRAKALPPAPQQRSTTRSSGPHWTRPATIWEDSSWTSNFPSKYSGSWLATECLPLCTRKPHSAPGPQGSTSCPRLLNVSTRPLRPPNPGAVSGFMRRNVQSGSSFEARQTLVHALGPSFCKRRW